MFLWGRMFLGVELEHVYGGSATTGFNCIIQCRPPRELYLNAEISSIFFSHSDCCVNKASLRSVESTSQTGVCN